eukprot:151565-Pyramimonas_sp.AAC.1
MIPPRPPRSPICSPAVSATAAASAAPNWLAAARANMRGRARPQRCTSKHQALIAMAAARAYANQVA